MSLSDRLNKRIEVCGRTETLNDLGEIDYTYALVKKIWAEIIPTSGSKVTYEGDTSRADVAHRITIRKGAIQNLTNDMYFIYKNLRYDIDYVIPNYKGGDTIEVYCSLVVE